MKIKNYAFVALAVIGLAACKKNNSDGAEQQSTGENTKIRLSLSSASSGTKTYAPAGDNNATVAELEMNTVDIFIYDNESPYALTHKHLEDTDNSNVNFETDLFNGARKLKNGVELDAKTGDKLIYVGVNLPESMVSQIKATQGLSPLEGVFSALELFDTSLHSLPGTGMAMFSNVGIVASFGKSVLGGIPSNNQVSLQLTRMLAKVTVDGTDDFNAKIAFAKESNDFLIPVQGGSIDVDFFDYSLVQTNKTTYLKGNGVVSWVGNSDYYDEGLFDKFKDGLNLNIRYAPENLGDNDRAKLTYAVVQTKFIPNSFADGEPSDYEGGTFYTVTDPSNGSVNYYINEATAKDNAAGKEYRLYPFGYCYYHIYLNPENDHKIARNEYYQVKVSNIRGIGNSRPNVAFELGGSLYNAELLDRITGETLTPYLSKPVATNTNIESTITIVPWNVVAVEVEL